MRYLTPVHEAGTRADTGGQEPNSCISDRRVARHRRTTPRRIADQPDEAPSQLPRPSRRPQPGRAALPLGGVERRGAVGLSQDDELVDYDDEETDDYDETDYEDTPAADLPADEHGSGPVTLEEALQRQHAKELRKALSLNDRFRFRRELFGNSDIRMNETLALIDAMHSYDEAEDYILNDLHWDLDNPEVAEFMKIVQKHFPVTPAPWPSSM